MRRVLTHSVFALLVLGGTMGASPGHLDLIPQSTPVFLPVPQQQSGEQQMKTVELKQADKPYQVGKASWYGGFFQGQSTANGENYNMYDFTAAHRDLPLGSFIKVTNLANRKSVIVRVNDRGPYTPGRILDLSYRAASSLGMHQNGLAKVRIDIVDNEKAEMAMVREKSSIAER